MIIEAYVMSERSVKIGICGFKFPAVMPRVSLAVFLTWMGDYGTGIVRSEVPRLQPRRRLY